MEGNVNIIDVEEIWNLKTEAHNNIFNYLESKGLAEKDLIHFAELLKEYSTRVIKLNSLCTSYVKT